MLRPIWLPADTYYGRQVCSRFLQLQVIHEDCGYEH